MGISRTGRMVKKEIKAEENSKKEDCEERALEGREHDW